MVFFFLIQQKNVHVRYEVLAFTRPQNSKNKIPVVFFALAKFPVFEFICVYFLLIC